MLCLLTHMKLMPTIPRPTTTTFFRDPTAILDVVQGDSKTAGFRGSGSEDGMSSTEATARAAVSGWMMKG